MIIFLFMYAIDPKNFLSMETSDDQIEQTEEEEEEEESISIDEINNVITQLRSGIVLPGMFLFMDSIEKKFKDTISNEKTPQEKKNQLQELLNELNELNKAVYDTVDQKKKKN